MTPTPPPFRDHGTATGTPGTDPPASLATETDLTDVDFTGLDLRPALRADPRPRTFTRCTFTEANLRGADLGELTIAAAAQFSGAMISVAQAARVCAALGLNVVD
ncbi:pentapeptide repeat-containing protein (plasmid) [Embleya sp. NBC_00888]|uniref:pentapeptide repeat-containing protein n=1 Tax=Embleya sp. NBC_00888 TaxID=2975960 RepID=UPI002F90BB6D|nr:pentapeptide repeat-containing protein [Embleya sp. NBC_00888]